MQKLIFSTGNASKFSAADGVCAKYGLKISQYKLDIAEIQSEDAKEIITDKVKKAFAITNHPVIVSDDSWHVPALNGFPGAYMKSINHWLKPEVFIDLVRSLNDRRIFQYSYLAYTDGQVVKLFFRQHEGYILEEPRGQSGLTSSKVISMFGDNDLSIAEVYDQGLDGPRRKVFKEWDDFCEWYLKLDKAVQ